jgi:hypothetical protein
MARQRFRRPEDCGVRCRTREEVDRSTVFLAEPVTDESRIRLFGRLLLEVT